MDKKRRIGRYLRSMVAAPFDDDDDIFSRGLVDSLFALQLVLFIEKEFGIHVKGEDLDLDNFCSVNAMASFVSRKLGGVEA